MRQDKRSSGLRRGYTTLIVLAKALGEIGRHADISFAIGQTSENVNVVGQI